MAEWLAIQEINQNGGVLGKTIWPVFGDLESDGNKAYTVAESFAEDTSIPMVFGVYDDQMVDIFMNK